MNNLYRKLKKNSKALSPVVASIILIAVTVAVSVVVAAWMGGMTIGLMGNAEQVTVQNAVFDSTTVTLTIKNSGASAVTITQATIDGGAITPFTDLPIAKGEAEPLILTHTFTPGAQYDIRLITAKGTVIVYTATPPG